MKRWKYLSEAITGITAGILGSLITVSIIQWFKLPDHATVDMLTFTESAFGIGMTVIALVFALVLVNQVKEIDRRFAEKEKEIDERVRRGLENMWDLIKDALSLGEYEKGTDKGTQADSKMISPIIAPSMMTMGLDSKPIRRRYE